MTDRNAPCPCGSGKKYKKCCMNTRGPASRGGVASPARSSAARTASAGDAEALLRSAWAAHDGGDYMAARQLYEQVQAARRRDPRPLVGLARIDALHGRLPEAITLARRAVALDEKQAPAWDALADLLLAANEPAQAIDAAKRSLAINPANAAAHRLVAAAYERMHRLDEALQAARRAVAAGPDFVAAQLMLAQLLRRTADVAGAAMVIEQQLASTAHNPVMRSMLLKELALIRDKQGEYVGAFEALVEAGEHVAGSSMAKRLDADQRLREMKQYERTGTRDLFERAASMDFTGNRPGETSAHPRLVFLVGHPRSGTTMTEQVLAAHSMISTSDEQPLLDAAVRALPGGSEGDVIERAAALDREGIRRVRAAYWARVNDELAVDIPADHVFIDKLPLNLILVGLINVVFPEAKLIVALRDPRDVVLSCFMQQFAMNASMVNFLRWERTAVFYAAVMGFWLKMRERITLGYLEVRYEDTVTDLETQSRRLLEHLHLPWEDDVLQFHRHASSRMISTPSYAAVTEQVHTRAVQRWRNYEQHYAAVSAQLQPFVKAFGYE